MNCEECRQPAEMANQWFTITHETENYTEEFGFCCMECLRDWVS